MSPTIFPCPPARQGLHGSHVLGICVGFFAAVFIVNGAMIYLAITTNSGLSANEPYRKGLNYNERIAAGDRQARLGWTEALEVTRDGRVRLWLTEADGRPVRGIKIVGLLGRPATNRYDIPLKLVEASPGHYEARTTVLPEGGWLLSLEARELEAADPVYRMRRRLWLKP
jgi:nitrogen fixation protein FixH